MTSPYTSDPDELGITREYGEDTVADVVSTFPFSGSLDDGGNHPGDGNPQTVIVRKPRP